MANTSNTENDVKVEDVEVTEEMQEELNSMGKGTEEE